MYFFTSRNQQPNFVYYPATSWQPSPFAINISIPNIFTAAPGTMPTSPVVSLAAGSGGVPWVIQAATDSPVWTFDGTPIRSAVSSGIASFLTTLEDLGTLTPGAMWLVQQMLAQYLPLTFQESLYYRYGLNPTLGCIDIQPGMRLRIDFESYQQVPNPTSPLLNGFVGAGTSYIQVGQALSAGGVLQTRFSPFLGLMPFMSASPNTGGGAGAIDLTGQAFALPYFRLLYPKSIGSADGSGSTSLANNVVIFGAPTMKILNSATGTFRNTGIVASGAVAAFFRGRAMITPEIPIFIDENTPVWVEVGTTLRQALSMCGCLPRLSGVSFTPPSAGMLQRWIPNFDGGTWTYPAWAGRTNTIGKFNFFPGPTGYQIFGSNGDSFDVPLHGGDYVAISQ